jgi:T4 RnlA family RNA ligase
MIPTYRECLDICEKSSGVFYESRFNVDGFNISVFNYRLATYQDFLFLNGFELRGLTFVFDEKGEVFGSYPLLEKFFNINENESTLLEVVSGKKIKSVLSKEDGSIISFIKLPNGKIIAKSKNSFTSDQAIMAQKLYEDDKNIKQVVNECLNNNLNPIFELVSPRNRVVVNYTETDLILLSLRGKDGQYYDIDSYELNKTKKYDYDLDHLLECKNTLEGIEGWVVEFEDNQKIKIKTNWYLSLHRIMTDYTNREDYLIDFILEEKIDDILSLLEYGSESRLFVEKVLDATNRKINDYLVEINNIIKNYDGDKKSFALKYSYHPLFGIMIKTLNGYDLMELVKEFVRKKTYRLFEAREWLDI